MLPEARSYDSQQQNLYLTKEKYIRLPLETTEDRSIVCDSEGHSLFLVNRKVAGAINAILNAGDASFEFYESHDKLLEVCRPSNPNKVKTTSCLNANVYGSRAKSDNAGTILLASEIFLQSPSWSKPNVLCDNPQMIRFPDVSDFDLWFEEASQGATRTSGDDWGKVLDDLPQHYNPSSHIENTNMHTTLLR